MRFKKNAHNNSTINGTMNCFFFAAAGGADKDKQRDSFMWSMGDKKAFSPFLVNVKISRDHFVPTYGALPVAV
jgi:hypothetical protein